MDRQLKKRYLVLALEAGIVIPLCALGLIFSSGFIIAAIFIWLAFTVYNVYLTPGGPW